MIARKPERAAFADVIEQVARKLVTTELTTGGAVISTPLLYPSGATVVVRVDQHGSHYFVTDMGLGYHEADLMGATASFSRQARIVGEHDGIGFDEHAFYLNEVTHEQLPGAVCVLANSSLQAATYAAYRLAEKKGAEESEQLYRRLVKIFEPQQVLHDSTFLGASSTTWPVGNVVHLEKRITIFESVASHRNSITSATTKFHDFARLPTPPNRVAVVRKKEDLGTLLAVLSQAAAVITHVATDETLRKLAA